MVRVQRQVRGAALVAIGALLWILGNAFVLSWRHSGDRLRSILSEFDNHNSAYGTRTRDQHPHAGSP
jgi:hypothetical protein